MARQNSPVVLRIHEIDGQTVDIELERRVKVGGLPKADSADFQVALQMIANAKTPLFRGRAPRVRKVTLVHLVGGKRIARDMEADA